MERHLTDETHDNRRVSAERAGAIREHYDVCPACGQAFDMRSLAEALHHNQPKHQPLISGLKAFS
jgi:hypothetical protein